MTISEFGFRLILLFIPGIIAFVIIDQLIVHRETKVHHWIVYSLPLAFLSYFLYFVVILLVEKFSGTKIEFILPKALINLNVMPDLLEIVYSSLCAIVIGFLVSGLIHYQILFRFAHWIHFSNKYGAIDLWHHYLQLVSETEKWVIVHESSSGLSYKGFIRSSSDPLEVSMVLLEDVTVYKNYGQANEITLRNMKGLLMQINLATSVIEIPGYNLDRFQKGEKDENAWRKWWRKIKGQYSWKS